MQWIALTLTWAPTVAHNGYLDEPLATGVVDFSLTIGFWLAALGVALWRGVQDRDEFAGLAAACIALFLLLNWGDSIMQFYFRFPFYAALTALFALLGSAGRTPPDQPAPLGRQFSRAATSAGPQNARRNRAAK